MDFWYCGSISLYLSSWPGTLVLVSSWYLEISVVRSYEAFKPGDVLGEDKVSRAVCLLVGVEGGHVELGEDHPLHGFPVEC